MANPIYRFTLNKATINLLDRLAAMPGYTLNQNTGAVVSSATQYVSDFMEVTPGQGYLLITRDDVPIEIPVICWYDKARHFISGGLWYYNPVAPPRAAYARIGIENGYAVENMMFSEDTEVIFEENNTNISLPIYNNDFSIEWEREQGQMFYRRKLSGKLTFVGGDFDFIESKPFDFEFRVSIEISYDKGKLWTNYWNGHFYKTDCEFSVSNKAVKVTPSVLDKYTDVLAGMDREFDLIKSALTMEPLTYMIRPIVQVYVPGQTVIGCYQAGSYWERECKSITSIATLTEIGDGKMNFSHNLQRRVIEISGTVSPADVTKMVFVGEVPASLTTGYEYENEKYIWRYRVTTSSGYYTQRWSIFGKSSGGELWAYSRTVTSSMPNEPSVIELQPVEGGGVATATLTSVNVYCRILTAHNTFKNGQTYRRASDDIVDGMGNHERVCGVYLPGDLEISPYLVNTPTEWGICQPGLYYQPPSDSIKYYPVVRTIWGKWSLWFRGGLSISDEQTSWEPVTVRDSYPLWVVVRAAIQNVDRTLTFGEGAPWSQFFYAGGFYPSNCRIHITPKSNILKSNYTSPAAKAPMTLKLLLDMLRDTFKVYFDISDSGAFQLEHVSYFMNGRSYEQTPDVALSLSERKNIRNGKAWEYGQLTYQFDKPEMPERYEFAWMDDVSEWFMGKIVMKSNFVNMGNVENVTVNQFTSDIDFMTNFPEDVSKDGFALLCAGENTHEVLFESFSGGMGTFVVIQNGFLTYRISTLLHWYRYDMPCYNLEVNGVSARAYSVKRQKNGRLKFPSLQDPDVNKIIQTQIGNGIIRKLSLNLQSRQATATLEYDTE